MKTQKGITLIALIITIIVMLILVGVSVSVALNTGLFSTAQGIAKDTEAHKENETKLSSGKVTIKQEDGTEKEVDIDSFGKVSGTPRIGDYVTYSGNSTWQVAKTENNKVTIYSRLSQLTEYTSYNAALIAAGVTTTEEVNAYLNAFAVEGIATSVALGDYATYLYMLTRKANSLCGC